MALSTFMYTYWRMNDLPNITQDLTFTESYTSSIDTWITCKYVFGNEKGIASWVFDTINVSTNGYILWLCSSLPSFIWAYNETVLNALIAQFEQLGFTINQTQLTRKSGYFYPFMVDATSVILYNVEYGIMRFESDRWDEVSGLEAWLWSSGVLMTEPLKIDDDVTIIGKYGFCGASKLYGTVKVPDSVTYIGNLAFSSCFNMTQLILPQRLQEIGNSAFYSYEESNTIIFTNPYPIDISEISSIISPEFQYIWVPPDAVEAYKENWSEYASVISTDTNWFNLYNFAQSTKTQISKQNDGLKMIKLSQAQYDALAVKDPNTLYVITTIYSITGNASNCFINYSNVYSGDIMPGESITLEITADSDEYAVPTSITVSGATVTYTKLADNYGTLIITNPTGAVTFTATGEAI